MIYYLSIKYNQFKYFTFYGCLCLKGKAVIPETVEYIDYNNFGKYFWINTPDEIINPEVIKYKNMKNIGNMINI